VQFDWIDPSGHYPGKSIGFIAQETMNVVPEVVHDLGGFYGIDYGSMTALLAEAVKEQQTQIDTLNNLLNISISSSSTIDQNQTNFGDIISIAGSLLNVRSIASADNKWTIDSDGRFITRLETSQGTKEMYAMQSETAEFVFSSSSQLIAGEVNIVFDAAVQEIIDSNAPLKVSVTLTSGEAQGIFVSAKTAQGFTVKELGGGNSNATFDWMVVAKRRGEDVNITVEEQNDSSVSVGGDSVATEEANNDDTVVVDETESESTTNDENLPAQDSTTASVDETINNQEQSTENLTSETETTQESTPATESALSEQPTGEAPLTE